MERLKDSLALIFFLPIFVLALIIMLPALVQEQVPIILWPVAVVYGLYVRGPLGGNRTEMAMSDGDKSLELLKEWMKRVNLPNVRDLRERTSKALFEAESAATLERTTQNSLEDKAILDLLRDSIRPHLDVDEDCYFSCPKAENYCGNKPRDVCNCGADEWNERVKATLNSWGRDIQRQG